VIPAVLAEPLPSRGAARPPTRVPAILIVGVALVLLGTVAMLVWLAAVSPYGFARFALIDADRTITVREGGTYVVFEEFPGATSDAPTLPVEVSVLDGRGRPLAVTPLLDPTDPAGTPSYQLPWREGRAIAEFRVPSGGTYLVLVTLRPPGTYPSDLYALRPADIAIGREISTSWLGSPFVAIVAGALPAAVGAVLVVMGAGRWRQARRVASTGSGDPLPMGVDGRSGARGEHVVR
jgi:hypothetical protein